MNIRNFVKLYRGHAPEMLYFDYLYSEYSALDPQTKSSVGQALLDVKPRLDEIHKKRENATLSWNDLYCFELLLADFLPVERLRSKIMSLRYDYRSIAGQREFDDYMAAKPPDLMSPPDPTDPPHATQQQYEKLLREDLKDLLGRLYLRYAVLPVKEARLRFLTKFAAGLCLAFLIGLLVIVVILSSQTRGENPGSEASTDTVGRRTLGVNSETTSHIASLAIFVVVASGIMGGFVSALQRIQSPPSEGDSIYNLSLLFNGTYSVFVAPITGAIFAVLLYFMFSSGILKGSFFPEIYNPPVNSSTAEPAASPSPKSSSESADAPPISNSREASSNASATPVSAGGISAPEATQTPTPNPSTSSTSSSSTTSSTPINADVVREYMPPSNKRTPSKELNESNKLRPSKKSDGSKEAEQSLRITDFLVKSGPVSGADYALLIIWSFIAGFAERFVPDALDRLIPGGQPKQDGKS